MNVEYVGGWFVPHSHSFLEGFQAQAVSIETAVGKIRQIMVTDEDKCGSDSMVRIT